MECMCAQTRPRLNIRSSERVLGEWSQNPCYLQGKNPLYRKLRRGSNPLRCITQDSEPNTLPTELFRFPVCRCVCVCVGGVVVVGRGGGGGGHVCMCMHACIHACMDGWMYVCMCVCACVCLYASMYVCLHLYAHICLYLCLYLSVHLVSCLAVYPPRYPLSA